MKNYFKLMLLAALLLSGLSGSLARAQNYPEFIGALIPGTWDDEVNAGIHSFKGGDATLTEIQKIDNPYANQGAIFANGKFFCVSTNSWGDNAKARLYDTKTWTLIKEMIDDEDEGTEVPQYLYSTCMARDPKTGNIYGCFKKVSGDAGWELGTIDIDQMQRTTEDTIVSISDNDECYLSLSFDADGQLYGIKKAKDPESESWSPSYICYFYKIDKANGTETQVGEALNFGAGTSSGTIDTSSNKYYYIAASSGWSGSEYTLYEIDLTSGKATEIADAESTPQYQFIGLAIKGAEEPDEPTVQSAPAKPTDLALNFASKSLTGTVSFKAPATTADGNAAQGDLSYKVAYNGLELTGNTTFGADVTTQDITLPKSGIYKFQVSVSNEAGSSPAAEIEQWIGQDTPTVARNIVATRAAGKVSITWDAVSEWLHGGNITEAVTYTVMRYIGNAESGTEVASGLTTCTVEDAYTPDGLTAVSYGVRASATISGTEGRSNTLVLGSAALPFADDFATGDGFVFFTSLDRDNDGNGWWYNPDRTRVQSDGNTTAKADDWLFTPPFNLKAGHQYHLTFKAASGHIMMSLFATLEVGFGNAPTPDSMTMDTAMELKFDQAKEFSKEIKVEQDGTYHFCFHSISSPHAMAPATILNSIEVTICGIPVTGVSVEPKTVEMTVGGENLHLTATVTPAEASDKTVQWTSSNEAVATVNALGVVTAVAEGETDITVTTVDGGFKAVCKVKVKPGAAVAVTGVSVEPKTAEMTVGGENLRLTANVAPANATNKSVRWTSSNNAVATVDSTGSVTAVAAGQADITATTVDGGFTAICKVTVKKETANETETQPAILSVYPNPTSGILNIEIIEPATLEVFTTEGRCILRNEVSKGLQTIRLEKSGFYLIRVTSGKRMSSKRVVKL